ncbi:hypothetical protein LCM20_06880 [Halobacillus litoralis]|uniref:hypothetical protein n=1 Tax=Halobacillus litoralis TaxID=45668 RepID=UPI001CD20E88|nr:hypothetical protein [Halobacillus litoralis]MCA0970307.1 hypothetical protein [Halobacillus litoralis]
MKRKSYDDNQIENLVKQLPSVQDQQRKDELYQNVQKKMNKSEKKKAPWLVPAFASVAVVLVMVMIIPSIWSSMNLQFQSSQPEMGEESGGESSSGDEASSSEQATMESADTAMPALNRMTTSRVEGKPMVYFDSQAQVVVPVSWVTNEPVPDEDLSSIAAEAYGLTEPSARYSFEMENNEANVVFPAGFKAKGSATENAIVRSIQWRAEANSAIRINVSTEEGGPVNLGNRGEVTQLSTIESSSYVYHLFTSTTGVQFLVPVPFEGTIEEALESLKRDQSNTSAPVPPHLVFEQIDTTDDILNLTVSHDSWRVDQNRMTAVEAILMTAKQYGFEEVQFQGITPSEDAEFDYTKPIPVPGNVNPLQP